GLAFEQRRDLFRTLRALGVTAKGLSGLLAGEMALVALLAAGLGIAMGYGIAAALLPNVATSLGGLYGAEIAGSIALRPAWILSGLAMTLGGAALATGRYLWQLAHSTPRANSLPRAWMRGSDAALRRQGIAACALILAAPLIAMLGQGLVAGFAILAAFLLGAALALPPLLSWAMGWASARARRPLAEWFWADCRLQLPGLSLALMALMLAVAANIGVSTMVGSFRSTFTGWLDQRLPAELYINAGDDALAERLAPILQDEAESVLIITSLPAQLAGRPGTLYGQADHPTFRDNWPLQAAQPGVWQALHQGQGVLINEQLAYGADLSPGDMLEIDGRSHPVLGIYSDYGNPKPQAIAGLAPFLAAYPEAPRHRFALRLPPKAVPGAIARLQAAELRPDQVMDQAGLKATSKQVFERTFAVTAALNFLTLAVAGLAILTSLLTLAAQRLPQIAPVWAMGLSRAQLGRLELLRAGVLAALTVGLALPVGLVLAWLLLAVINVEAFGWRLPMHLFPGDWARIGALAIAAALLAAAWPARHLATRPPGDLLRRFANER
ncbi:MAG: FtsX-like permease family protein, partial [Mangrovicoccus sp.]|nr:FtsX-like permease family protein [Mangrovicoccus sp.]